MPRVLALLLRLLKRLLLRVRKEPLRALKWAVAALVCWLSAMRGAGELVRRLGPDWVKDAQDVNPGVSITGHVISEVKRGHLCRRLMSPKYPGIVRVTNGLVAWMFRDLVIIKDPRVSREILEEPETMKPQIGYRSFQRLHGYVGGADFLSFRSHLDPLYARTRPLVYRSLMARTYDTYGTEYLPVIDRLLAGAGGRTDAVKLMHSIAIGVLTRMAFAVDDDTVDRGLFENTVWMICDSLQRPQNIGVPLLDWLPTKRNRKLWSCQRELRKVILNIVEQKRAKPGDDAVSALLAELSDMTRAETDKVLIGLLGVFFFAGFDTTANTMALILHLLAEHPEWQQACREEVFEVIGSDPEAPLDLHTLFHCPKLMAVIKETMRLYPVVPMVSREVTKDHVCGSGISKRLYEPTCINIFGLHYNPKAWTKPTSFCPERWLEVGFDDEDPSERVYCPFALGKRACLGRQFAMIEMLTVMTRMLQLYRLFPTAGKLEIIEGGTLCINNLFLKFVPLKLCCDAPVASAVFSVEEVRKHCMQGDLWIILDGLVFDVTEYARKDNPTPHPGGREVLLAWGGSDASAEFGHVNHSAKALNLLKGCCIGRVAVGTSTGLGAEGPPNVGESDMVRTLSGRFAPMHVDSREAAPRPAGTPRKRESYRPQIGAEALAAF